MVEFSAQSGSQHGWMLVGIVIVGMSGCCDLVLFGNQPSNMDKRNKKETRSDIGHTVFPGRVGPRIDGG